MNFVKPFSEYVHGSCSHPLGDREAVEYRIGANGLAVIRGLTAG